MKVVGWPTLCPNFDPREGYVPKLLVFRCYGETCRTYLARKISKKFLSKRRNRGSKKLFVGDYLGSPWVKKSKKKTKILANQGKKRYVINESCEQWFEKTTTLLTLTSHDSSQLLTGQMCLFLGTFFMNWSFCVSKAETESFLVYTYENDSYKPIRC